MRHHTSCYSMTSVARLKTGEGPVQLAEFDDSVPCLVGFKLDNKWDFMAILLYTVYIMAIGTSDGMFDGI